MEILIALVIAIVSGIIVNIISKIFIDKDEVVRNQLSNNIVIKNGTYNKNSFNNNVKDSFNETNNYDNSATTNNYGSSNSESSDGFANILILIFAAVLTTLLFAKYFIYINIAFIIIFTITFISTRALIKKIALAQSNVEHKISLLDQIRKSTDLMLILLGTYTAIIIRYFSGHFDLMFEANSFQSMFQLMMDNHFEFSPIFSAIFCYIVLFINLFIVFYRNMSILSKLKLLKVHPDSILAPLYRSMSTFVSDDGINIHKRKSFIIKTLIYMTTVYVGIEILFFFLKMLN